jgi:hypothetical protein
MLLVLGLLAISSFGGVSAQGVPGLPEEPEVWPCAFPAALGALFLNCSTGQHQYSELITHGITGSVWTGVESSSVTVRSALQVADSNSIGGWKTVHAISCTSFPDTLVSAVDSGACEETGDVPPPGTNVRHQCSTSRAAVGLVACHIVYLR